MVWADAVIVGVFFFGNKIFATVTIPALIIFGVDMLFESLPNKLDAMFVRGVGCANKVGRGDAEFFNKIAEEIGVGFCIFFDGEVGGLCFFEDFVTVFVGSSLEFYFVPESGFIARINVGEKIVDGMTEVGSSVNVRNSGSKIFF